MSDNVETLIAEAKKAADEIHRWAFGADDEIPDGDRHEVRLRVEAITDALKALEAAVRVPSDTDREALIAEARSDEPTDWRALAWHLADALEALDSAPPVARPLPGREVLARVIDTEHMRLHGSSSGDFGVYLRIADAVLAAIEKGGESAEPQQGTLAYAQARAEADGSLDEEEEWR